MILGPIAIAQGCSLINSYDDVKPFADAGSGEPDSSQPSGTDSGGTDAGGQTDTGPLPDAEPDVITVVDSGPTGIIVVGGRADVPKDAGPDADGGTKLGYVLSTLDPVTGKELSREQMPLVAAVFDKHGAGADGVGEVWYLFEFPNAEVLLGSTTPAGPTTYPGAPMRVHVRTLDTHSGKWTELAKVDAPPPVNADVIGVLKDQLVYVAHSTDGGAQEQLVVLDTTTPGALATDGGKDFFTALPYVPNALVAVPKQNQQGGVANVFVPPSAGCTGTCTTQGASISVTAAGPTSVPALTDVASTDTGTATPSATLFRNGGSPVAVVAMPPADAGIAAVSTISVGSVVSFVNGASAAVAPFNIPNATAAVRFGRGAVAECSKTLFVPRSVAVPQLYGIPVESGGKSITPISLASQAHSAVYEPYTGKVIAAVQFGGDYGFVPFGLTVSGGTPSLQSASFPAGNVPADLRPHYVATRNVDQPCK